MWLGEEIYDLGLKRNHKDRDLLIEAYDSSLYICINVSFMMHPWSQIECHWGRVDATTCSFLRSSSFKNKLKWFAEWGFPAFGFKLEPQCSALCSQKWSVLDSGRSPHILERRFRAIPILGPVDSFQRRLSGRIRQTILDGRNSARRYLCCFQSTQLKHSQSIRKDFGLTSTQGL